jgi:DNA-binding MarR family transcriptional regulator
MQQMFAQAQASTVKEWSDLELSMAQMRAMMLLGQRQLRMTEIADALGRNLSSVTSMVDRLVQKGLVERISDPDDRRVVLCQLTEQGRGEITRFRKRARGRLRAIADVLTTEELEQVVSAAEVLARAATRLHPNAEAEHSASPAQA